MTTRNISVAIGVVLFSSVAWAFCFAQYRVEPDTWPSRMSYRVRVINDMGRPVCIKIIPFRHSNYFHADMAPGESTVQDMWSGQRAICVWDDRTGQLLVVGGVTINRNGGLHIRPMAMGMPKAGAPQGGEMPWSPAVPSLNIEDN